MEIVTSKAGLTMIPHRSVRSSMTFVIELLQGKQFKVNSSDKAIAIRTNLTIITQFYFFIIYRQYHKMIAITSWLRGHLPIFDNKNFHVYLGGKGGQKRNNSLI